MGRSIVLGVRDLIGKIWSAVSCNTTEPIQSFWYKNKFTKTKSLKYDKNKIIVVIIHFFSFLFYCFDFKMFKVFRAFHKIGNGDCANWDRKIVLISWLPAGDIFIYKLKFLINHVRCILYGI